MNSWISKIATKSIMIVHMNRATCSSRIASPPFNGQKSLEKRMNRQALGQCQALHSLDKIIGRVNQNREEPKYRLCFAIMTSL